MRKLITLALSISKMHIEHKLALLKLRYRLFMFNLPDMITYHLACTYARIRSL